MNQEVSARILDYQGFNNSTNTALENNSTLNRRLSFNSPPKLKLNFNQSSTLKTHTPKIKHTHKNQPLIITKQFSWIESNSNYFYKYKHNSINKENIIDVLKKEAPASINYQIPLKKEVLEFSQNKSKRKVKTVHSSKTKRQRKYNFNTTPFVSCFQQQICKIKNKNKKEICIEDFQIIRKVGRGRFGNVFLAVNRQINFVCALKVISKKKVQQQKCKDQIIQQIKIQSKLQHHNLVSLFGFFDDHQNIYLILQYCSQGDLYGFIKKRNQMQEAQSAKLIKQILEGLVYLHQNKIIHRDIKPQNIMMEQGVIKIGDFGWAASCQNGLRKTFCGTPLYLSPQILLGEQYDQGTDIWALGILVFEIIIGSNPFQIKNQSQLNRIVHEDIKFPTECKISLSAKDFILRILEKNSKYRMTGQQLLSHPFLKYY